MLPAVPIAWYLSEDPAPLAVVVAASYGIAWVFTLLVAAVILAIVGGLIAISDFLHDL